jgi:hypothetical protein
MKKILLICTFCLISFFVNAQILPEAKPFNDYSQTVSTETSNTFTKKDYPLAINQINAWYVKYNQLTPKLKTYLIAYSAYFAYDMACAYSRESKIDSADTWLEKSIADGFTDCAHILVDDDLNNLHNDKRFQNDLQQLRNKYDYGYVLKASGSYNQNNNVDVPAFTYQSATDSNLLALRRKFNLDSVSGNGDETSKLKRLLYWVHNEVKHDGSIGNPKSKNAIDLIAICKKENRGVNCRMMATILRDVYQSEGFPTRIVTCMPKDTADGDCHVITVVWSKTLNKWVWMDPTFNAYITDDKGNLLNIEEVREKLINGDPLVLNDDANWNNQEKQTKEHYLGYYMSKNLYWLQCSTKSEWDLETDKPGKQAIDYINLYPGTYNTLHQAKKVYSSQVDYAVNNPDFFWQKPVTGLQ